MLSHRFTSAGVEYFIRGGTRTVAIITHPVGLDGVGANIVMPKEAWDELLRITRPATATDANLLRQIIGRMQGDLMSKKVLMVLADELDGIEDEDDEDDDPRQAYRLRRARNLIERMLGALNGVPGDYAVKGEARRWLAGR